MSIPWGGKGKIGAWAEEAEREDAEERERLAAAAAATGPAATATATAGGGGGDSQSFPSLREAVAVKPKKKKATPVPLSEFMTGTYNGPGGGGGGRRDAFMEPKRLTPDEMRRLPTGPKERSAEEMEFGGRLGGGFRSYGRTGPPPPGRMGDDREGSWGGGGGGGGRRPYGGFDDDRRAPQPRASDFDQPSRADEVDNWAVGKKPLPLMDSGRNDRYSSLGSGSGGGGSRADEVDNWAIGKKPLPVRTTNFGSGFRDSAAPESDRWSRGEPADGAGDRERPRMILDAPRVEGVVNETAKMTRPSPFGEARPREEVLAAKGLDWKKLDSEIETNKTSRPTSSHSSRPSSAQSNRPETPTTLTVEGAPKPRPKVNPFGDAKPREVLLEEQGKDWRKIDFELEHRGVDRPETEEEKMLKEEISNLKKELEKQTGTNVNGESLQGSGGEEQPSLHEMILRREKDLELLIRELDDKVRFGEKATDRPGSGAGRRVGFPERPPSQSGMSEDPRNLEFMDRPRSRGTVDAWTRPGDDRQSFPGDGRGGGFLGNREMDRPRSRGTVDAWTRPGDDRQAFPGDGRGGGFFGNREMDRPRSRVTADAWTRPGDDRQAFPGDGRGGGFFGNREMDRPWSRGTADAWTRPGDDRQAFPGDGRGGGFLGNREIDRPRSRGTVDAWTRPGDDRQAFPGGGRGGGFLGNREMDRSRYGERW